MKTIVLNDLNFEISYSQNRKNMEIVVDREGGLSIKAPKNVKTEHLRKFLKEKEFWVYTKLFEKQLLLKSKSKNQFRYGEKFPYLGKAYSLSRTGKTKTIALEKGKFILPNTELDTRYFVDWYSSHARKWISQKISQYERKLGIKATKIRVLDLGNRWGSCSSDNTLNFHWRVILAPPKIVEYVIVHEIIHMIEKNHTPEFWKKLGKIMPDYLDRKQWLQVNGASLDI